MFETQKEKKKQSMDSVVSPSMTPAKRNTYSVILEGFDDAMENAESFAIKFSVLARVPVTKIKHIVKRLPATLWKGQAKSRALHLLSLIEEAGGIGRLVEEAVPIGSEGVTGERGTQGGKLTCRKCGFPLKKNDEYCDFCMTPVNESVSEKQVFEGKMKTDLSVRYSRLLLYGIVAVVAIIIILVLR